MRDFNIGIDNGVTGSVGIVSTVGSIFYETPVVHQQSYTKKKQNISRVNFKVLYDLLEPYKDKNSFILIERPMVNPSRFMASMSALRALESTLIVVEQLGIPHAYIDSKEWQKVLLPKGTKGPDALKKASLDIGSRLFPSHIEQIVKHGDADSLLIAEYCRRTQ